MSPRKFPDGSRVTNARAESACLRAIDSCLTLARSADRLSTELDHIDRTIPGSGIIRLPVEDDDSLMVAVREARDATGKA
jgi:hypothetical protein